MTHSQNAARLSQAIHQATAMIESGADPEHAVRTALVEAGIIEAVADEADTQEYYLLKCNDSGDLFLSVLPRTAELDAYLFKHSRRKADDALVEQISELVLGTQTGRDFMESTGLNVNTLGTLIRDTLNMNNTGLRYGRTTDDVDNSVLLLHKIGALSNFALSANEQGGMDRQVVFAWNNEFHRVVSFARTFNFDLYDLTDSVIL